MDDARPSRRWFRFSLRTLLIAVLVAAVPLGFLVRSMQLAARQRRAVDALKEKWIRMQLRLGYRCIRQRSYRAARAALLLARLGEDFFYNVESVSSFDDKPAEGLSHLREFPHLKNVIVPDRPIGDAVARQLSGLQQLKYLDLSNSALTDDGLKYLRGLTGLESLDLYDNPISGTGLTHIGDSRHLTSLMLESTRIDDRGMRFLKPLTELKTLGLGSSPDLTDEGIKVLAPMVAMKQLSIIDTGITDQGLAALKDMRSLEVLILAKTREFVAPALGTLGK